MSIHPGRNATRELTRIGLVLSPRRARGGWLAALALGVIALAIGAGGSYLYWQPAAQDVHQLAGVLRDNQQLQQKLEQTGMSLRLAQARSQELEHQIDALNRQLHECQEELTFFRKTGAGKH